MLLPLKKTLIEPKYFVIFLLKKVYVQVQVVSSSKRFSQKEKPVLKTSKLITFHFVRHISIKTQHPYLYLFPPTCESSDIFSVVYLQQHLCIVWISSNKLYLPSHMSKRTIQNKTKRKYSAFHKQTIFPLSSLYFMYYIIRKTCLFTFIIISMLNKKEKKGHATNKNNTTYVHITTGKSNSTKFTRHARNYVCVSVCSFFFYLQCFLSAVFPQNNSVKIPNKKNEEWKWIWK